MSSVNQQTPNYLPRELIPVCDEEELTNLINQADRLKIKIMTWNILAQCLVKRNLFPGCDCLKWKERGKTITQEIINYDPDVICLQEVDRLPDHGPILTKAGYDFSYMIGGYEEEGKQHGLLIGWKLDRFQKIDQSILRLDEEVYEGKIGLSRSTRNIGLLCALKACSDDHRGLVIGTAHLFWHARFVYERSRQTGFLSRGIQNFKNSLKLSNRRNWITCLAGDFNDQPNSAGYRFLTGIGLDEEQRSIWNQSKLIHKSVDDVMKREMKEEIYETIEGDDDRVFKDVRQPNQSDGLLNEDELHQIYGSKVWISLYGRWGERMKGQDGNRFKDREEEILRSNSKSDIPIASKEDEILRGDFEPMWTNFTPLWRCTLDYIFILDDRSEEERNQSIKPEFQVISLLPTHRTHQLEPGLPRMKIEPSDHIPLMAELII